MRKTKFILCFLLGFLGVAHVAMAEDGGPKTEILNFEDELIQGEANKHDLFYILEKKQFNYRKLIKLRNDFLPEMRQTSQQLQGGTGN